MGDTKVKTDIETPAGYNGGKGPGDALKMPTKHYPASGSLGKGMGKGSSIEGPATGKKY